MGVGIQKLDFREGSMATSFNDLRRLYDNNQFAELLDDPDGIYWLKLRSVSRAAQLREFCQKTGINCEGLSARQLLPYIYDSRPDEETINAFIQELYERERAARRENENYLVSQLYQMKAFNWGGLYQNSLEQTIVNNYVKQIQDWNKLNQVIENELLGSMRGYVRCSWYNHWTSIIIEDIFKDHPAVLPAIGLVKKVDFFIHNFPYDLKVTYFPDGYMGKLRRGAGLRPEFTELKAFCRQHGIWFEQNRPKNRLFPELLAKISEHPSQSAKDFMTQFRATRADFIQHTIQDPIPLKIWLYENQGIRRFDAANRFFLVLIDKNNLEESWKLKRNKVLLADRINTYLGANDLQSIDKLKIEFHWQNEVYATYTDILFVTVE